MINSPSFVGYTRLGAETTATKTDLREVHPHLSEYIHRLMSEAIRLWHAGNEDLDRGRQYLGATGGEQPGTTATDNPRHDTKYQQYPDVPGVKELVEDYIAKSATLSQQFMRFVSECLSLPPDTFVDFKGNMDRLKLVKYPQSPPDSQGVGPHKDSTGLFTFLSQDDTGGLQVLNKNGQWIDAPPIEGSLVVNVQQGLEAITGGICAATTHRVIVCPRPYTSVR